MAGSYIAKEISQKQGGKKKKPRGFFKMQRQDRQLSA